MMFTKRLREGVQRGRIRCSVRIWMRPLVKVGGRYRMDEGHIVVDAIRPIRLRDVSSELARESGFHSVRELLETARHGRGQKVYLIRFHYLPPGACDTPPAAAKSISNSDLLSRIRSSRPPASARSGASRRGASRATR